MIDLKQMRRWVQGTSWVRAEKELVWDLLNELAEHRGERKEPNPLGKVKY